MGLTIRIFRGQNFIEISADLYPTISYEGVIYEEMYKQIEQYIKENSITSKEIYLFFCDENYMKLNPYEYPELAETLKRYSILE